MKYLLSEIIEEIDVFKSHSSVSSNKYISEFSIDSRSVQNPTETIFFALQGENTNGIEFIPELITMGVQVFVVDVKSDRFKHPNLIFIQVEDVLATFQRLAVWHRQHFQIPIIGITGSNGKTIVKEWLDHLLNQNFNICRSPGSYNSQIGVPLSILQLNEQHELGIFEAGISRMGEMSKLAPIINCQIGVFTHLGDAHDAGFADKNSKLKEKLKLFTNTNLIIYNSDNQKLHKLVKHKSIDCLTWSYTTKATFQIKSIEYFSKHTRILVLFDKREIQIEIPFTDISSVENAMSCLLILHHFNLINNNTLARFSSLPKIAMRLELLHGWDGMLVVNDTYSADIESLKVAMKFASHQAGPISKCLVISEFMDVKKHLIELYKEILKLALRYEFSSIVFIGSYNPSWNNIFEEELNIAYFKSVDDFISVIDEVLPQRSLVLLKGARKFRFEKISDVLTKPTEGTRLEIDLNKIKRNLQLYRKHLGSGVSIMAMIKASAYGAGFVEIARFLTEQGVDYFGVAYISEGVSLRREGIKTPIFIMNPEPGGFFIMAKNNLEPVIYDFQQLDEMIELLRRHPFLSSIDIHIKINTGMNRLGFSNKEIDRLLDVLKQLKKVQIKSVFTHLSATDNQMKDSFTSKQIIGFSEAYSKLSEGIKLKPKRHVLNSSGIPIFRKWQFEMVRLGIGLYGLDRRTSSSDSLEISHRFISYVAQVRTIHPGEYVGYGANNAVSVKMKIATISTGYADGISRLLGNGNYAVNIKGFEAKTIGNICMDMFMVDVTGIPDIQRGDEVVVFGDSPSIYEMAEAAKTIPYEIISSIGDRVKRLFLYH